MIYVLYISSTISSETFNKSVSSISTYIIVDWISFFYLVRCILHCHIFYFVIFCFLSFTFIQCKNWVLWEKSLIDGLNSIVEIDEVKIGERKLNKGCIVNEQWIFTKIDRVINNNNCSWNRLKLEQQKFSKQLRLTRQFLRIVLLIQLS